MRSILRFIGFGLLLSEISARGSFFFFFYFSTACCVAFASVGRVLSRVGRCCVPLVPVNAGVAAGCALFGRIDRARLLILVRVPFYGPQAVFYLAPGMDPPRVRHDRAEARDAFPSTTSSTGTCTRPDPSSRRRFALFSERASCCTGWAISLRRWPVRSLDLAAFVAALPLLQTLPAYFLLRSTLVSAVLNSPPAARTFPFFPNSAASVSSRMP